MMLCEIRMFFKSTVFDGMSHPTRIVGGKVSSHMGALTGCNAAVQVFMTFLLVATVYAAAVAKPGHGNTAPLAIGLSLYAAALTGESAG